MDKNYEILSYKKDNWFINCGTVDKNNGLFNQSYKICINANINEVKRLSDGKVFIADGKIKQKTSNMGFYITHFWENHGHISCAGYYNRIKNPYNDYNINSYHFSPNICSLDNLI